MVPQLCNYLFFHKATLAQAEVIHSFGRSDQLDVDALRRLIKSVSRFLGPEDAIRLERQSDDLRFVSSRPAGGAYLLKALWQRLNIGDCLNEVFWSTAILLNLTVDLIFFDTTNTYFEIEEPGPSDLKAYGKSKQKRDDLPQETIGLAVTREGIPM